MIASRKMLTAILFAFGVLVHIPAASLAAADFLAKLSSSDRATLDEVHYRALRWSGDKQELADLKSRIDALKAAYPDSVPVLLEAETIKWMQLTEAFGAIHASKSALPWFLEFQKMEPDYPDPYLRAAQAYIYTGDLEGALPSLNRLSELAPDDPWTGLTWAMLSDRKRERGSAVHAARSALSKSGKDEIAMARAILTLAKHGGVDSQHSAQSLAKDVCVARCDQAFLTTVISAVLDRYSGEPGALAAIIELAYRAGETEQPKPKLLLQWARLILLTGNGGMAVPNQAPNSDPLQSAEAILLSIKDKPDVASDVWGYRFDIAMSRGVMEDAESLLKEAEVRDFPVKLVGRKKAALLNKKGELGAVQHLYRDLGLSEDRLWAEATARNGQPEVARLYYEKLVEAYPTNAYVLGDFAMFLFWHLSDAEGAIVYGQRAYDLIPYPLAQQTIAAGYLTLSGRQLGRGQLDAAAQSYALAEKIGFDPNVVVQLCWETCGQLRAAMTAFHK